MSTDLGEKTEEATPRRKRDARKRGEVPQSREFTGALVLVAALALLLWRHPAHLAAIENLFDACLAVSFTAEPVARERIGSVAPALIGVGLAFLPFLLGIVLAGIFGSILQVGPLFTMEPLALKPERLNPAAGLKRMFFSLRSWVDLLRAICKVAIMGAVSWFVIRGRAFDLADLIHLEVRDALVVVAGLVSRLTLVTTLTLLAFSCFDLFYQRWQSRRDMRMSKDEVKRDWKDEEGAPEHKGARQRAHAELIAQCNLARVEREADVVIVNPTHYACALRYEGEDSTPRLIAKARDAMALRLRNYAERRGIPVRQDVGLARALHELAIDSEVPEDLYDAVAVALDWVRLVLESRGEVPSWVREPEKQGNPPATGLVQDG